MNYLVTGGAGFIGSNVAKRLIDYGHDVTVIDNLSTGFRDNIPTGCHFIYGDTHDSLTIDKLEQLSYDAIFHIAGQSSGAISFDDPIYDMNSNAASTLLLLEYAKKVKCRKFVYASTMSVYGDDIILPAMEVSTLNPKSFYAVGKIASEHYMRIYTQFGIKTTALRLNNTYGPGQNMKNLNQGMVSIFIAQAIQGEKIHVKGSKDRFRDFVYIDDVVDAFILSEQGNEDSLYNVYNVATGIKTTCEQLISYIQKYYPTPLEINYEGYTPGDQFGIYCSYDLIKTQLGWKPSIMIDDGIKTMVEWAINSM